jgi:cell wall-associated NlpC family hydrolase
MVQTKKTILNKVEQSHGIRITLALLFTIGLMWFFVPEKQEQDELARLVKTGDWQKLVDKSDDFLKKEQTPKAFYYKAKGHFQLFKKAEKREEELRELSNALEVIQTSLTIFPATLQTEYQFAMRPIIIGAEHYFYYLKIKGDTNGVKQLSQHTHGLFNTDQQTEISAISDKIVTLSFQLLGTNYTPGGVTPSSGFDCSGFTRYVFKQQGMILPHGAFLQINSGVAVNKKEVKKADLIFFADDTLVSHVGIVVGKNNNGIVMIHADSEGVIETDETSNEWKDYWSKKHITFKRLLVD